MAIGDGAVVRAALDALLSALHRVAQPTGARGSVLLMTGGLIVLGFLFMSFLFRSAIVGDLASSAHARAPSPRALMPDARPIARARPLPFEAAREKGRSSPRALDAALDHVRVEGADARVIRSGVDWKIVRLFSCSSCNAGANGAGCEHERGLIAGAFEAVAGDLAKVHEIACVSQGARHCEFEVRHAPIVAVRA